jgi:hypothetical protein
MPFFFQDMLGQGTSMLTSTVGSGIVFGHKKMMQAERMSQGLGQAGLSDMAGDSFTASVTMVLNGVNAFLYQLVLFPLYTLIASQKTMVCTSNDLFGLLDATGYTVRLGKPDLQRASDVSSGQCLTAFMQARHGSVGESDAPESLAEGADGLLRSAGQGASSVVVAGGTASLPTNVKTLTLLSSAGVGTATKSSTGKIPSFLSNAANRAGSKASTLFEKFKSSKIVTKIGGAMNKITLKAPIHLLDSMITYAIGVVSGLQDMVQVSSHFACFNRFTKKRRCRCATSCASSHDFILPTTHGVSTGGVQHRDALGEHRGLAMIGHLSVRDGKDHDLGRAVRVGDEEALLARIFKHLRICFIGHPLPSPLEELARLFVGQ